MRTDFLREMFSPVSIGCTGVAFVFLGVLLWIAPHTSRFVARRGYAEQLRAAGEKERSAHVDAETKTMSRRLPIYGRLFVAIGFISIVGALAWPR